MKYRWAALCLATVVFLSTSAFADDSCDYHCATLFITNDTDATLTLQTQTANGRYASEVITLPPGGEGGRLVIQPRWQYLFAEARRSNPPLEAHGGEQNFESDTAYYITISPSFFGRASVSDAPGSVAPDPPPSSAASGCAGIPGTWDWFMGGNVVFRGTGGDANDANQARGFFTSGPELHGDWFCFTDGAGVMVTMTWSHDWTDELRLVNPDKLEGEGWKTDSNPHEGVHDVSGTRLQ